MALDQCDPGGDGLPSYERRGQAQARAVIGKGYLGMVNTDSYAAYHWLDAHRRQLCWAHLKREFEAIKQRGGTSAEIGEKLLEQVKALFDLWRQLRAGSLSREAFDQEMKSVQSQVKGLVEIGATCEQARRGGRAKTCSNTRSHCGPSSARQAWNRPIMTPNGPCGGQCCGDANHSGRRAKVAVDL